MKKQVVELKPGDVILVNGKESTIKKTWYLGDNVRIHIEFLNGAFLIKGQFEEVDLISR